MPPLVKASTVLEGLKLDTVGWKMAEARPRAGAVPWARTSTSTWVPGATVRLLVQLMPSVETNSSRLEAAFAATDRPATASRDAIAFFMTISSLDDSGVNPNPRTLQNERLVSDPVQATPGLRRCHKLWDLVYQEGPCSVIERMLLGGERENTASLWVTNRPSSQVSGR